MQIAVQENDSYTAGNRNTICTLTSAVMVLEKVLLTCVPTKEQQDCEIKLTFSDPHGMD